jgi:glycosyltransferase involved in cell wall biosynthesis
MLDPLNICLVGGIYGKDFAYRAHAQITPETTLERGLRELGHFVTTYSPFSRIHEEDFDVVHVHHLGWGALGAAMRNSPVPYVFTLHDTRVIANSLPLARRSVLRLVLSRADGVVALSRTEKDFLCRNYSLAREPVIIPNGIDPKIYSFVGPDQRPKRERWRLLYVGQLIELKRVDVLLKSLRLVATDVELFLAYHVNHLESELKELARELGIGERVHFLGSQSAPQLAHLYQEADLLVLPSGGEALPSVVAEAMFCGTPVVATRVGGVPEQLGSYGITVRPGCPQALAAAIVQVLANYTSFAYQAEEMSRFARSRASTEVMVEKHLKLYRRCLEAGASIRRTRNRLLQRAAAQGVEWICQMKCANWPPITPGRPRPSGDTSS